MQDHFPEKVHIIGSVGSGKTTLAKKLSSRFQIPFYELDNVVWIRKESGDLKRTEEQRMQYLNTIIGMDCWIIEGVHNEDWVAESFKQADLIIFLDTKYTIRTYRIVRRFLLQKIGLEKSNYKPTLTIFKKMFKWNKIFEEVGKPNFFQKYNVYQEKLLIVNKDHQLRNYFNKIAQ
ncbi:DNA topology modulation protein FlaR [Aquibacillus koreensis]|uniref:DNA topology modulation protein FlaR n=1 Tax=Aquibacillus koreensis TaxID=279446 RepID=A0A9X3WPR8_9BACI|nr:DNA topology modulation protein FlaR [Aquibacillus koreensis]MCT2536313.1 DNA topology modulation protein FlaR [Aquibacillus koreensis]MDC3421336.1 DNA topology modulation protein FlaR [Aquibacillus koreensis]